MKGTDAQQMSEAFDMLEEDLWRGEGRGEEVEERVMLSLPPRLRDRSVGGREGVREGRREGGREGGIECT